MIILFDIEISIEHLRFIMFTFLEMINVANILQKSTSVLVCLSICLWALVRIMWVNF